MKSIPNGEAGVPALSGMLTFIERAARDPSFDVNKFSVLLDRQEALLKQHQAALYDSAYADMQDELTGIKAKGRNPTFSNAYAKLEDLDRAARPVWSKHGFALRYGSKPSSREGWLTETLCIAHRGGHREVIELSAPIDFQNSGYRVRTPVQAVGSTITYLRRYLMQMGLNLVPENDPTDDDGEGTRRAKGWVRTPRPPEDEWEDPETHLTEGDAEKIAIIAETENFRPIAEEAAKHGHEQLAILYKNSSAARKGLIKIWQTELEALYPKPDPETGEVT